MESLYRGHRFPSEIISRAVWLYHRFTLSLRDVEDLLAERGVIVSYETIRCWCFKFGPQYAKSIRRKQGRLGDIWHIDELFVRIQATLPSRSTYVQTLLKAYLDLPETPLRSRPVGRRLAHQLYDRALPLNTLLTALLLASARRLTREPQAPPLQPIRSLHYFVPVIWSLFVSCTLGFSKFHLRYVYVGG